MKLFNRFCFHTWSDWGEPFQTVHYCDIVQVRKCLTCGKTHIATIKQPWNKYLSITKVVETWKGIK